MYYKVVRVLEDGRRVSSYAKGEWQLGYGKDEPTEPEEGYLWVFECESDSDAERLGEFVFGDGRREVWECEAEGVCCMPNYKYSLVQEWWLRWWSDLEEAPIGQPLEDWDSMRWATKVRLIRLVVAKGEP